MFFKELILRGIVIAQGGLPPKRGYSPTLN